jgi:tRNA threonylcarbamoyladenosine dehydratase
MLEVMQTVTRGERRGLTTGGQGLALTVCGTCAHRWDASQPATVDNLLLLTFEEADAHDATTLQALQQQEPELYRFVDSTLRRVRVEYGC